MSANPYENEPGFEDANDSNDKKNQTDYVQKVLTELNTHGVYVANGENTSRSSTRAYG